MKEQARYNAEKEKEITKQMQEKTKQVEAETNARQKEAEAKKADAIARQKEADMKQLELQLKLKLKEKDKTKDKNLDDMYKLFLDECTEKSDTHIHTVTLFNHFKNWFKQKNTSKKAPGNKTFISGIRNYATLENVRIDDKISTGIKNLNLIT